MSESLITAKAQQLLTLSIDKDGAIEDAKVLEVVRALLTSSIYNKRAIARELGRQADKLKARQKALVTSAYRLDVAAKEELMKHLGKKYPDLKTIEWREDSELIGGFTVQVGDQWYDASVANDLHNIREQLSQ